MEFCCLHHCPSSLRISTHIAVPIQTDWWEARDQLIGVQPQSVMFQLQRISSPILVGCRPTAQTRIWFLVLPPSGVRAVGGNFFTRDASFNVIPALVGIIFADGSSSIQNVTSTSGFFGFISSDLAITSLQVSVYPAPAGVNFAAVDNLYFGIPVPAPSALGLLGLAGIVGRRRR